MTLRSLKSDANLAKWAPIVNECINSGITKQEWCQRNGINIKTYHYWQKRIFDASVKPAGPEFAELKPVSAVISSAPVASITAGTVSVNLFTGIDSDTVRAIVKGLSDV